MVKKVNYIARNDGNESLWVPLRVVCSEGGGFIEYGGPTYSGRVLRSKEVTDDPATFLPLGFELTDGHWLYRDPEGNVWAARYCLGPGDREAEKLDIVLE